MPAGRYKIRSNNGDMEKQQIRQREDINEVIEDKILNYLRKIVRI